MFQAGGWVDYKYRMYGFPSAEKFKDLKEYVSLICSLTYKEE